MKLIFCANVVKPVLLIFVVRFFTIQRVNGNFINRGIFENASRLLGLEDLNTIGRHYGIAVTDVDRDDDMEFVVASFSGSNLVLKYDKDEKNLVNLALPGSPFEALRDEHGQAIGAVACDVDGDGTEEIYVINTNQDAAGVATYRDKLFIMRDGKYADLLSDSVNMHLTEQHLVSKSVICLDRHGRGKYGFLLASYNSDNEGRFALLEMDASHSENSIDDGLIVLEDNAAEAGLKNCAYGGGVVAGPILHLNGKMDLFFTNEGSVHLKDSGGNFLFENIGNGSYVEVAEQYLLQDSKEAGRGVALFDFDHNGLFDIVYGNFEGPQHLYLQYTRNNFKTRQFADVAGKKFAKPSPVQNVLVADFDNNVALDILLTNIHDNKMPHPNKLFTVFAYGIERRVGFREVDIGDASELGAYNTGAAYTDVDGDGMLELLLSHGGEKFEPLAIYKVSRGQSNNFLRVLPRTQFGSPARGATVEIETVNGDWQMRVIDSGSGYLCQMEPIAHFGLGMDRPKVLNVRWPDGRSISIRLKANGYNKLIEVWHPDLEKYRQAVKAAQEHTFVGPPSEFNYKPKNLTRQEL